jgi:hypothetical protein
MQKMDRKICFQEKRQFFRRKFSQIDEAGYRNIVSRSYPSSAVENCPRAGLPDVFSNPIIQILVHFGGPWNGKCWTQSYDFLIYSYNASVVVPYTVSQSRIKYICIQNALGYPWRCKK